MKKYKKNGKDHNQTIYSITKKNIKCNFFGYGIKQLIQFT